MIEQSKEVRDGALFQVVEGLTVAPSGTVAFRTHPQTGALVTPTITTPVITGGTITSSTIASPTITSPTITGAPVTKYGILTETGAGTSYTITIAVPAGAVIHEIGVAAHALWDGTSAALNVGDTADTDGYFAAFNLKATDLLVGEILSTLHGDLWGGKNGAYLVAASGRRGPVATNFGNSYLAGSNIIFAVTAGAADGSAGRTRVWVTYSVGETTSQVVA